MTWSSACVFHYMEPTFKDFASVSCEFCLIVVGPHPTQLLPHLHLIPVLPPVSYQASFLVHDKVSSARPVSPSLCRLDPVVIFANV